MKEYFSLFIISFMVLETCLATGSSPSYAMRAEWDEVGHNIIISNAQQQKTHKIPFHQPEELTTDLRLTPYEREALWLEEKSIWCHHPYLSGKVYSFQYPEVTEITLSYPAVRVDLLTVAHELHAFNFEKVGKTDSKHMTAFVKTSEKTHPIIMCEGQLDQHSLHLSFNRVDILHYPEKFRYLLRKVEDGSQQQNTHAIYIQAILAQYAPLVPPTYLSVLQEEGFLSTGTSLNLDTGHHETGYYKIIDPLRPIKMREEFFPHLTSSIQWDDVQNDNSPPNFGRCFGVFVRDDRGLSQGGVFGRINPKARFPYAEIEVLWLHEMLRGKKLGEKIMLMAENFAKANGALISQLGTTDFQAPGFYKKLGYKQFTIYPEVLKACRGVWGNLYGLRKQL